MEGRYGVDWPLTGLLCPVKIYKHSPCYNVSNNSNTTAQDWILLEVLAVALCCENYFFFFKVSTPLCPLYFLPLPALRLTPIFLLMLNLLLMQCYCVNHKDTLYIVQTIQWLQID